MFDISDKLTVFVIKCGDNPNYNDCIYALKNQTCKYTYWGIENYKPMSQALQMMLNMARTPYFIQVDEDMILKADTIEKMYTDFQGRDSDIAMNVYLLHDPHLNKDIEGIKIYDTAIFKKYPFNLSHPSCEVEQLARMEKDGYHICRFKEVVGLHSPKWTPDLIYKRYFNLAMKWRLYGYNWMGEELHKKLIINDNAHPSKLNHYALLGYINGLNDELITKEKSG